MPPKKRKVETYDHRDKKRSNNPPVGLVTPGTDPDEDRKQTYAYDPHLDPQLQWSGKAEHTTFEVPDRSLHVHERIDPRTIIEAVRKRNGSNGNGQQPRLFEQEREIPLREAIEFYKHAHNWSNRLIAGDSLLVMNSLLQKENMAGKVQCVYIDPPYGIKYGSNFQPFTNKRDVKDGKDEDLTAEPEMIKAFRDTWELGIHSYLTYIRDRLLLAKELLTDSGSCFVQISDENLHHVRELMDEVFGKTNFFAQITFKKTLPLGSSGLAGISDYILWYASDKKIVKYRQLYEEKAIGEDTGYRWVELPDGSRRRMTPEERVNTSTLPLGARPFFTSALTSSGYTPTCMYDFEFEGRLFKCGSKSWRTHPDGMKQLITAGRIMAPGTLPTFVQFHDDFPVQRLHNLWNDTHGATDMTYAVQTSLKPIQRCILMTTDPGDLVFDPTCGSGTTAYVAEQWGRRWITCDTSRVATTLAKQRLMTATFDYYKLAWPDEGVGSGFEYKKVPHITLKSIANNEPPATETLFDQPIKDNKRARVTGPFTVEAVPAPQAIPLDTAPANEHLPADNTVARSGETLRQKEWGEELLNSGIRGKGGQRISFARIEPLPCHHLHADAETKPDDSGTDKISEPATAYNPRRAVISFGPEHAPLEQRQVENALQEAATLKPKPEMIVFAAFQFDPEAAKDIDETIWPDMTILKVQMNADLQTEDLKKKSIGNESFWLIGQPDVYIEQVRRGHYIGQWQVGVSGFDYFNTKTGELESGDENQIAVWMLDTDYDGRCLYPSQVFFPGADGIGGWEKLARNLNAEIDQDLIGAYAGALSLPFELGKNKRIAVKIVDNRGIESLRVMDIVPLEIGNA